MKASKNILKMFSTINSATTKEFYKFNTKFILHIQKVKTITYRTFKMNNIKISLTPNIYYTYN